MAIPAFHVSEVSRRLLMAAEARRDIEDALAWLTDRSESLPARFQSADEDVFASVREHRGRFPAVHHIGFAVRSLLSSPGAVRTAR